jgi:hypothetical protein
MSRAEERRRFSGLCPATHREPRRYRGNGLLTTGEGSMSIFQIKQKKSGAVLWTGAADDEQTALDAMAREAGYRDFSAIPDAIRADGIEAAKLDLIS